MGDLTVNGGEVTGTNTQVSNDVILGGGKVTGITAQLNAPDGASPVDGAVATTLATGLPIASRGSVHTAEATSFGGRVGGGVKTIQAKDVANGGQIRAGAGRFGDEASSSLDPDSIKAEARSKANGILGQDQQLQQFTQIASMIPQVFSQGVQGISQAASQVGQQFGQVASQVGSQAGQLTSQIAPKDTATTHTPGLGNYRGIGGGGTPSPFGGGGGGGRGGGGAGTTVPAAAGVGATTPYPGASTEITAPAVRDFSPTSTGAAANAAGRTTPMMPMIPPMHGAGAGSGKGGGGRDTDLTPDQKLVTGTTPVVDQTLGARPEIADFDSPPPFGKPPSSKQEGAAK